MPDTSKGLVAGNPANNADPRVPRTRSRVELNYANFGTYRFGEYGPHYVFEGVPSDKNVRLNSRHDVRSYTMKAPLMSDVKLNKDYFLVYLDSILPRQAERIITNPTIGDDVDAHACNCVVDDFEAMLYDVVNELVSWVSAGSGNAQIVERQIKAMLICENFFSSGSLLASLGAHLDALYSHAVVQNQPSTSFDTDFDAWVADMATKITYITINTNNGDLGGFARCYIGSQMFSDAATNHDLTFRQFLEYARENYGWSIQSVYFKVNPAVVPTFPLVSSSVKLVNNAEPFSLARPLAYQLSCAQYFTNDRVDYIYDAELYRQAINSLWKDSGLLAIASPTFTWNGLSLEYDILSGHYFWNFFNAYVNASLTDWNYFGELCSAVFGFRRSLRYVDYFTGSRPFPLAVGDVNVQVNSNLVNAVDVITKSAYARYYNAVMRTGRRVGNYLREIMGAPQRSDYHTPLWLGKTTDGIFAQETENTGSDQFTMASSVSSVMRGAAARFGFELDVDRYCVIVGVTSFDIPRAYARGVDRFFRHVDRFDMFNPMLQYIGDQPVLRSERDAKNDGDAIFGYTSRYGEYRQHYGEAFGGFVEALPGWTFLADESRAGWASVTISPDFIRSSPSELDKFFVSLTGYSLGTYFHFIIKNQNSLVASRPMALNPQLM